MDNLTNVPNEINRGSIDGYIRPRVYNILSTISGNSLSVMNDNVDLKFNLYLTNYHLRNLWRPFQQIILSLNSSDSISPEECERLIKVKDCIDLIKKKAFVSK